MATNILTAVVASVKVGRLETEGLRTDCGRFAIAAQQIARLFSVSPTSVQKSVKRALGEDVQFPQIRAKNAGRQNRPVNAIWLPDFSRYHRYLDRKGNKIAIAITDALNEAGWNDLFSDAFGVVVVPADRQAILTRVMDAPRKFHPLFGDQNMDKIASFLKVGRNHPKLANWMWAFVYHTLSRTEIAKLDELNPIQPNGHRKQTIHQWLEENATEKHKQHFDKVLMVVNAAPSEQEFEDLFNRLCAGKFQAKLFDF